MKLIIVHRYDDPDRFGMHINKRQNIFDAVGLFTKEEVEARLDKYGHNFEATELTAEELIPCAPIEWHAAMREGKMLNRFTVYKTIPHEEPSND